MGIIRRGGRTANAPVLKTGGSNPMWVRIPPHPLQNPAPGILTGCFSQLRCKKGLAAAQLDGESHPLRSQTPPPGFSPGAFRSCAAKRVSLLRRSSANPTPSATAALRARWRRSGRPRRGRPAGGFAEAPVLLRRNLLLPSSTEDLRLGPGVRSSRRWRAAGPSWIRTKEAALLLHRPGRSSRPFHLPVGSNAPFLPGTAAGSVSRISPHR